MAKVGRVARVGALLLRLPFEDVQYLLVASLLMNFDVCGSRDIGG